MRPTHTKALTIVFIVSTAISVFSSSAQAQDGKPNILVIWGDDIGTWNISHNNRGMMGYRTPNIDRIAKEGVSLHRLLRPAELHGRAGGIPQRFCAGADRHDQGRHAGAPQKAGRRRTSRWPPC